MNPLGSSRRMCLGEEHTLAKIKKIFIRGNIRKKKGKKRSIVFTEYSCIYKEGCVRVRAAGMPAVPLPPPPFAAAVFSFLFFVGLK